jgi:hypothetical protein
MTGTRRALTVTSLVLLALVVGIGLTGCGGDGEPTADLASPSGAIVVEAATVAATTTTTAPLPYDALSTFESKDPFIPRVVEVSGSSGGSATTLAGGTTNTTAAPASTTTTQAPSGSTTTSVTNPPTPTTTLAPPLHSLKVVSIETYSGQPVVTFRIDGVAYQSKREGDIVSTSWGQIKVIDIDPDAREVVFLHGSEIRVLKVGQEFLK